ncbi:hypothetical protein ACIQM3_07430 [Streptomyces sp. NPDC091271]|uniref:hypothetical protein n=1 Tax=Streptomyces sp. NPDC091271 TaxID=3365980 RepID=UPI003804D25A
MPVLLTGRGEDHLTGVGLDDLTAAGLDEGDALDDVKGLPRPWECQAVRAPGEKRTMFTLAREGASPR